jgi:hypothetical protein
MKAYFGGEKCCDSKVIEVIALLMSGISHGNPSMLGVSYIYQS